ncbi:MAG: PepSY domain-containing protein [Clostridia bacterium]|nr:PepSY domain-containing protein [Clostridia bacterium]
MTKIVLAITLAILVFAGCAKAPDSPKKIEKNETITQEASQKENTQQELPAKSEKDTQTAQDGNTAAPEKEQQEISEENAKKFVLTLLEGASEKDIREFKKEYDDGKLVYDIKVVYNKMEYEFELDAHTGEIVSWDSESIYD